MHECLITEEHKTRTIIMKFKTFPFEEIFVCPFNEMNFRNQVQI